MEDFPISFNQLRVCIAEARERLEGRAPSNSLSTLEDACKTHDADYNKDLIEIVNLLEDFGRAAKRAT